MSTAVALPAQLPAVSSAQSVLALLDEPVDRIRTFALKQLDVLVDQHWAEISEFLPQM